MIAVTKLGTDFASTTNATSYTHTAVTPTANADLLVFVMSTISAGGAVAPTLSSPSWLSGSWTNGMDVDAGNNYLRLTLFSGKAVGSPGSATLAADYGAVTQDGCIISIIEVTGAIDVIRQIKDGSAETAGVTSHSVTLDSELQAATSIMLACLARNGNTVFDPTGSETEICDTGFNTPPRRMSVQYEVNDTTSGWSWTGTDEGMRCIAIEISDQPTGRQPRYGNVNFQDPGVF